LLKVRFKKVTEISSTVKQPKNYRRYQKRCILKSIDVTDNGCKKVKRYSTAVSHNLITIGGQYRDTFVPLSIVPRYCQPMVIKLYEFCVVRKLFI